MKEDKLLGRSLRTVTKRSVPKLGHIGSNDIKCIQSQRTCLSYLYFGTLYEHTNTRSAVKAIVQTPSILSFPFELPKFPQCSPIEPNKSKVSMVTDRSIASIPESPEAPILMLIQIKETRTSQSFQSSSFNVQIHYV